MSGQPKAVRTHSWRGNQTCSGWWFQPLWKIWVRQLRLFFTIYEIPWFQSPPSSNQCLACVLDWTNVPSGVFIPWLAFEKCLSSWMIFQPEHQGRWHHRQIMWTSYIHQASTRLGCPGHRVTRGHWEELFACLCVASLVFVKLGGPQNHGFPMVYQWKKTCWIV